MRAMPRKSLYWIVLVLVILALLGTNVYWEIHDAAPPSWDQSLYLEYATKFSNALVNHGPLNLLDVFATSIQIKAPLIALLPLPAFVVFGADATTGLLFLNFLIVLLNIFLFLLFKEVADRRTALLGVVLTATMPVIFGLSREFLVEYGLTAIVVMWIYFLITSDHFRKNNLALGFLAGLGLLMKANFPLYIFAPAAIVFVQRLRIDGLRTWKRLLTDVGTILITGMLLAGIWYFHNGLSVIKFGLSTGYGTWAGNYTQGLLQYWKGLVATGISPYLCLCLVLFAGLLFALKPRKTIKGAASENNLVIASWLVVPFLILSASTAKDVRYLAPVLPVIGLTIACLFFQLIPKKRVLPAVLILLLIPIFNLIYTTFPLGNRTLQLDGFPIVTFYGWNQAHRPVKENWGVEKFLSDINADANGQGKKIALSIDHKYYNFLTFSYFRTLKNYPFDLNAIGYVPSDTSTTQTITDLSQFDYIVAKTGEQGPEWTNYRNKEIRAALGKKNGDFFLLRAYQLPDSSEALLYKHY